MIKWNVFGILAGFAIGQGSMFLAQTYYMTTGSEELIASIGIGLGFSSLMWWLGDLGGSYILQRLIINERTEVFLNFIIIRFLFSVFLAFSLYGALVVIDFEGEIYKDITKGSCFLIILGSLNVTGYLDSRKINHVFGPLASLGWFFSAILYFLISLDYVELNAAYFSGSFYVGFGVYVVCQWVFILMTDEIKLRHFSYDGLVWRYLREAMIYTCSFFLSQAYGRFVPVVLVSLFGMSLAGLYVYAKSLVNISSQLISFIRRVEFENILKVDFSDSLKPAFFINQQRKSLLSMVLTMLISIMFIVVMVFFEFIEYTTYQVFFILLCLVMLMPWFIASAMAQIFIAYGYQWSYFLAIIASSLSSILLIYISADIFGLYSIVIAELLMFCLQIIMLYMQWVRRNEC